MNATIYLTFSACLALALTSCKKENSSINTPKGNLAVQQNLAINGTYKPLTVITVAGKVGLTGFSDGPGTSARFGSPVGIDLADDGTIYVTDVSARSIRKVSPAYDVSTAVSLPFMSPAPIGVRVQKNGTINILTVSPWVYPIWSSKIVIVKPNGEMLTPAIKTDFKYGYFDLEKDPYTDQLFMSGLGTDKVTNKSFGDLEKFEIKNDTIGTQPFHAPIDSLTKDNKTSPQINTFFCGYNGVKYIVINGNAIYKLTPSGVFTQIYRNLEFGHVTTRTGMVTSIVATKDSKTIYIADIGRIRSISNGVTKTLVGPRVGRQFMDGIGEQADVVANQLALSKDESTLYFTDRNAVRKLVLR